VFYLQLTHGTVTVGDLQSIADEIDTLWNADIKTVSSADVTMTSVEIVFVTAVGAELTYVGTYSRTGTLAGTTINDASACAVINWKISAYYRGGHPRSYMPGLTTAAVASGSDVTSGTRTSLATAWNNFRNSLNAFTTTNVSAIAMGTLSFASGNAWRVTPVFRPYTSVAVRAKLGSQRRRILT
jgi:hypothetical protein